MTTILNFTLVSELQVVTQGAEGGGRGRAVMFTLEENWRANSHIKFQTFITISLKLLEQN